MMTSVQDIRQWALDVRPVFICGLERSGTSILQVSMSRHPDLFTVRDVYETFIFLKPRSPLAQPVPHMTQAYLQGPRNVEKFRQFYESLLAGQSHLTEVEAIRSFFFFASYFVYDGKRPLEKTPGHVRKLPRVFEAFPRARVIVCTRDPVSVISSYRKRLQLEKSLGKGQDEWGWLDRNIDQLMGHFNEITSCIRSAAAQWPEQLFIAPYDWLTETPEPALREICAFAELPFSETVLKPKEVGGRTVDQMLSKPLTKRDPDIDQYLSEAEQEKIKDSAKDFADLWKTPGKVC